MNTAQYAIQAPVVQPQFDSVALSFKQIAAEVKDYLKAVKASWNDPLSYEGRLARLVEQQMKKEYLSHGIEGVDAFIDKISEIMESLTRERIESIRKKLNKRW